MSIERFGDKYVPTCDICGEQLDDEYEFEHAVTAKKDAGWISRKYEQDWSDICTTCQVQYKEELK